MLECFIMSPSLFPLLVHLWPKLSYSTHFCWGSLHWHLYFYGNFPLTLTVRSVDFLMKCTSKSLFTLSWMFFGEKWGRDILKIKFKLLLKMHKLQTAHLSKISSQWKRPAGRESQHQPMWVGRWKGLVRPFHSQELWEIFAPTVITLPSPHSLQLSLRFFFLEFFSTTATFFLEQQKPASLSRICPFWSCLLCLGPSPPWSTDPFTAHLCSRLPFFGLPFLPFYLPCTAFPPSILFSLTQTLLYISPGKIKNSLWE